MRTAFGRMGGTLRDIIASKLAGIGIRGLVEKTKIAEKAHVDCVFFGSAAGCSRSNNPARRPTLDSGLACESSASYVAGYRKNAQENRPGNMIGMSVSFHIIGVEATIPSFGLPRGEDRR